MITCRDCGTQFPKPTTRGRPPVKCESCRSNKTASTPKTAKDKPKGVSKKAAAVPESPTEPPNVEAAVEAAKVRKRRASYRSGFCGVTWINNVLTPHPEPIHKMCKLGESGECKCPCHKGVDLWNKEG